MTAGGASNQRAMGERGQERALNAIRSNMAVWRSTGGAGRDSVGAHSFHMNDYDELDVDVITWSGLSENLRPFSGTLLL